MNFLIKYPFVDVGKFSFLWFIVIFKVAFIYVYLEVVDFFSGFACQDAINTVWYGVCYMYVGCGDTLL